MVAPKLRFKEFDGDWSPYVLKDFVSFRKGKGISKADISENGINECIRYGELYTTYGQVIDHIHSKTNVSKSECILSKAGDVIIPASGETQIDIATASCVLHDDIILSGDLNILSHEENGSWLAYYLSSAKKLEIAQLAQGNSVVHLYSSQLKDLKINKPSKEEQTKIASFLSNVDEKISQLTQKHALLSQYKQGMMQKLFSQQIRFKADDGSEFGEWKKVKFSDKFKFHQTNSYSRALLSEQGEIMNIHYGDIHTKFSTLFDISKEVVPFLSSEVNTNKFAEDQFLQVGDLVIADASEDYKDIGKALEIIHLNNQKVVAGLHTYIARPVQPFALGFCGYLMQTFEVREQIKKLATGISVLGISKTNIGKVEIKVPCLKEQTKIANFLSAIDQKLEIVAQQIEQAKQWKKGLLQQMFV